MKKKILFLGLLIVIGQITAFGQTKPVTIRNARYRIEATPQQLIVSRLDQDGARRTVLPVVQVIQSATNPNLTMTDSKIGRFPQAAWKTDGETVESNAFNVGKRTILNASKLQTVGKNRIRFGFPKQAGFTVSLDIILPEGTESPVLEMQLTARRKAWFSAAFAGIAPQDTSAVRFLYQPMVWSWRRFPDQSYLTPERDALTAATFINTGNLTEGICPDPAEIPYRYAHLHNSRFGLLLRNAEGKAQPMLFAPILGGENSLLQAGEVFRFRSRYVLHGGDWYAGLSFILKDIFEYKNERRNATVTLNQTLDNMLNFAMHDVYGGWVDSLKGFDYVQDAIGTVKIVSAMHQLGAALVTGNEELYNRRALPTMAYAMSREKYMYTVTEEQKIQSPSHLLKGPCVEIGELSGLYQMTNGQTPAFLSELNRLFGKPRKLNLNTQTGGGSWQDYLYRYRITGNTTDLEKAKQGANDYLKSWTTYPNVFTNDPGLRDKEAAFLTDFTPKLYDLLELYKDTEDQIYLQQAQTAARQMLLWLRSHPFAPDSTILVNKGGKVKGIHGKRYKVNSYEYKPDFYDTTFVAEQYVPAWHTSLVGLPPEQPRTYGNGPIMLTHHPAWFLRLAHLTGDTLLRDAAYNAILGRYANFPGYYFNSFATNVYQSADYPMHPYWSMRYNSMFYNHVFPHITLLIDFLVSDALYRSGGKVDFPAVYAPGYAYLTSHVYGHQPGTVFGNPNIRLWLPPDAVQTATVALNHVLGVGEKDFYVILMNTFAEKATSTLRLNPDVVHWTPDKTYTVTVYEANGKTSQATFRNGLLDVTVPPQGLVAYKIEGLSVDVPLFRNLAPAKKADAQNSFLRDENTDLGTLTGMLFNTFSRFSDAYIFIDKTEKDFKKVSIEYKVGKGAWQTKEDAGYPYEFDIHLTNPKEKVEFRLKATDWSGNEKTSKTYTLSN